MPGGVILDEMNFKRKVTFQQFLQIVQVSVGVEDFLELVKKSGGINLYGTEDFHGTALPGRGNMRLMPPPAPGLMQSGVLPESGFVLVNQDGCGSEQFFLMLGYV